MIVFDVETGPLPDDELRAILPEFVAPSHPGEFDPASVKVGNLGEVKAAYKIQEARLAHEDRVKNYGVTVQAARDSHFAEFKRGAALSPITGRVLAIGVHGADVSIIGSDPTDLEADILWSFWAHYCARTEPFAGWNIHGFDLPFIIRRSWKLGVEVPAGIRDMHDRYWNNRWIDLMTRFAIGQWKQFVKLDEAAKFFGVGEKPSDCGGGDFAGLWLGSQAERERAIDYLRNDLELTASMAKRMGVAAATGGRPNG